MSFCCSCSGAIPNGNANRCIGCQRLIHSWCGAPCFDQKRSNVVGFEIGRACFPCYKGIHGVEYSPLDENGLDGNKENPLKKPFDYTDGANALLSSFNGEMPLMEASNINSNLTSLEHEKAKNDGNKTTSSNFKVNTLNIDLDTYYEFSESRVEGFAKCKLCKTDKVLSVKKHSYTSLRYHLKRVHSEEYELYIRTNPSKEKKPNKVLDNSVFTNSSIQLFSKLEAIRFAVRYSASENLSFKSLENKFFQEIFQRSIRPNERKTYTGRKCFAKDFTQYYNETKLEKIKILGSIDSKISITTDVWNSPNQESFVGITAHWIDAKFELHNMLLCFTPISKMRATTGLNSTIESCLKTYSIQNKILGITLDNSAPKLVMMDQLNTITSNSIYKKNQSPCLAHIFHLTAQAFVLTVKQEYSEVDEQPIGFFYKTNTMLDLVNGITKNKHTTLSVFEEDFASENMISIKDNNFIFRESDISPEQENLTNQTNNSGTQKSVGFSQNSDSISKLINALKLLKSSPHRRIEFTKLQQFKNIKPSIVVLDNRTHWNSTYKLIAWAIKNKEPFTYFMAQEKLAFTDNDWGLLLEVKKFLSLFDEKINFVTGQKLPPISKAMLAFEEVLLMIKETNYPDGSILSQALINCYRKLLKYASILKNDVHIMGITLDPSLKDTFYMAYNWSDEDKEEARLKMMGVYEEYLGSVQVETNNNILNSIKKPRAIAFRESIRPMVENEMKKYLEDLSDLENDNLLYYWRIRSTVFPTLGRIARDYLAVCATTIPIEHEFSCTKEFFAVKKFNTNSDSTAKFMEMKCWEIQQNQFTYIVLEGDNKYLR